MRILLDEGVPVGVKGQLGGHDVETVPGLGWAGTTNGALLSAAEAGGFDAMITGDQNLIHQQNLAGCRLRIVVLSTNHWPTIQAHPTLVPDAISRAAAGHYLMVRFPRAPLRRHNRSTQTDAP